MNDTLLITPTLLNSYEFAKNAPPYWKDKAMRDFIAKIKREPTEFSAAAKKGIEFEDVVYNTCTKAKRNKQDNITVGSEHFQKVANKCLPGTYQDVVITEVEIDGFKVRFYQKTDVSLPDKIIDIKTTSKWKGENKYLSGWQHKTYLWATSKKFFEYLVVVFESEDSNKIVAVEEIPFENFNPELNKQKIFDGVSDLFNFIKEARLFDDYYYTFSKNKRYGIRTPIC